MTGERSFIPPDWPTVVPRLAVSEPEAAVNFIKQVFDATGDYHAQRPAELRIGDSLIMVASADARFATKSIFYVYVPDTDSVFKAALAAGGIPVEEPAEMPYGDRRAMIEDLWGNQWQIATHRKFHPGN